MNLTGKLLVHTALLGLLPVSSQAIETIAMNIKDHKFEPAEITIPANTKVKLLVKNLDSTPEEFESYEMHREKIIRGKSQAVIFIGPLKAGVYPFFGEFNPKTAQGRVVVK